MKQNILLFEKDLPDDRELMSSLSGELSLAVDTETSGLNLARDRLLLVQIAVSGGQVYVVKIRKGQKEAERLSQLLTDSGIEKIFHFARFDLSILKKSLGIEVKNVFCTKISSRLVRTYSSRHGLKDLCSDMLRVELDKQMQTSDWARDDISVEQLEYAANDVIYLHQLKSKLESMLVREGREELAKRCFDFLSTRVNLDLQGWQDEDIFSHK